MTNSRPRIFQIGFNRCGTMTLHAFFARNGLRAVHWDQGRIARRFKARVTRGEEPFGDYPGVVAFTDMMFIADDEVIEPYKQFEIIRAWYPGTRFILNTRDRERWVTSRLNAVIPLVGRYATALGIPAADVPEYWRGEWDGHHARVRAAFAGDPKFLEFNIERDDPAALVEFLRPDFPQLDVRHYGWLHRSADRPTAQSSSSS